MRTSSSVSKNDIKMGQMSGEMTFDRHWKKYGELGSDKILVFHSSCTAPQFPSSSEIYKMVFSMQRAWLAIL